MRIDDFAEFEGQVEEALTRLYDPTYHPPELLWLHLGFRAAPPNDLIRERLTQAIEQLQPPDDVPASARVRRIYDLLNLRYLQEKTQKEAALRLGITVRHLRREQQLAIHLLAERLWEESKAQMLATQHPQLEKTTQETQNENRWREQVRREIEVLQSNAPGVLANVQETVMAMTELAEALTAGASATLDVEPAAPDLWVATHPSVLREMLITALDKLVPSLQPASVVRFSTATEDGHVVIKLSGCPATLSQLPDSHFIDEVLDIYGGHLAVRQQQNLVEFRFILPLVKPVNVLVVDDNDDLVHFYRRYTEGTRYVIHHLAEGQRLWEKINQVRPDIIILDVMLPDIGGWDVLRQLRKEAITQQVPIIICSVIRHEELARTLGATLYLAKPVHRNDFLQALDAAAASLADLSALRQQQFRDA